MAQEGRHGQLCGAGLRTPAVIAGDLDHAGMQILASLLAARSVSLTKRISILGSVGVFAFKAKTAVVLDAVLR